MSAALTPSARVNVLLAAYVGIEAEQHRIASQDPTGRNKAIGEQVDALGANALAVLDEIQAIEDRSGNVDVASALILGEIMLHHDYAQLGRFEWGVDDKHRLKVLAALAGGTTGEVRRHTAAVLATIGITVPTNPDPFLVAIERYRAESMAISAWPDDAPDEAVTAENEAIFNRLFAGERQNPPPITTMAGAAAGIRQVLAETVYVDSVELKLLKAVLAFLEGRAIPC